MKFAVFALISMYIIVQTCGKLIVAPYRPNSMYYKPTLGGRKLMVPRHKTTYSRLESDSRRMIFPPSMPVIHRPGGALSSPTYNNPFPAYKSKDFKHHYVTSFKRNLEEKEPIEEVNDVPTASQCIDNNEEIPKFEDIEEPETNSEKIRKEICLHLAPKISSMTREMSPQEMEEFTEDFIKLVNIYCDFDSLPN